MMQTNQSWMTLGTTHDTKFFLRFLFSDVFVVPIRRQQTNTTHGPFLLFDLTRSNAYSFAQYLNSPNKWSRTTIYWFIDSLTSIHWFVWLIDWFIDAFHLNLIDSCVIIILFFLAFCPSSYIFSRTFEKKWVTITIRTRQQTQLQPIKFPWRLERTTTIIATKTLARLRWYNKTEIWVTMSSEMTRKYEWDLFRRHDSTSFRRWWVAVAFRCQWHFKSRAIPWWDRWYCWSSDWSPISAFGY